jgi:hypothetical protein
MITRAKYYWNTMTEDEKAGIKRATMEMIELGIVVILANILRGFAPDDDSALRHNKLYNFLLYQLSASQTELNAYTPYGWFNESAKIIANPMATYGLMVNSYKLVAAATSYPFIDDDARYFQGGTYNDRLKVGVFAGRLVPGMNVWQRIQALDSQRTAYKLY